MSGRGDTAPGGTRSGPGIWTVPNVICWLRIAGVAPALWMAWQQRRGPFLWIMVALLLSDWLDGKLAILLDQRTVFGARLDSAADALMYGAIGLSFWWLEGPLLWHNGPWILAVLGAWALSAAIALLRWGRLPSYHNRGAKISWLVVGTTAVLVLRGVGDALVPWALGLVLLTNLEAAAIGWALPDWRADVPSLVHALRLRARADRGAAPD